MPIIVECTACGKSLRAKDEAAGKRVRCSACGNPVTVPSPQTADVGIDLLNGNPFDNPLWAKTSLVDPPPRVSKGSQEWLIWTGLAASLATVAVGMVLFFNKRQRDTANQEVTKLVGTAKQAFDRKQWDEATESLRQALETRNATELDDAKRLLGNVEEVKAKAGADKIFDAALVALEKKQTTEAVRLLNSYRSNPHATKQSQAGILIESIAFVDSDAAVAKVLESASNEDIEVAQATGRIRDIGRFDLESLKAIYADTLQRQLPGELRRREAVVRKQEEMELAAKREAQRLEAAELAAEIARRQNIKAEQDAAADAVRRQQQALANPLPVEFTELTTFPERFQGKAVMLKRVLISSDLERSREAQCFGIAVTSNGKTIFAPVKTYGGEKTFVMPEKMGEKFLQTFNQGRKQYEARLCMTVDQHGPQDNPAFTYFVLYQIDIYQQVPIEAYQQGRILTTISN